MLYNQHNCWKVYVLTVYINGRVIFCRYAMNMLKNISQKVGGGTRAPWPNRSLRLWKVIEKSLEFAPKTVNGNTTANGHRKGVPNSCKNWNMWLIIVIVGCSACVKDSTTITSWWRAVSVAASHVFSVDWGCHQRHTTRMETPGACPRLLCCGTQNTFCAVLVFVTCHQISAGTLMWCDAMQICNVVL